MKIQTMEQIYLKKSVKDAYSSIKKDVVRNNDHYLENLKLFIKNGEKDPEYVYYDFEKKEFTYDESPDAILFIEKRRLFKDIKNGESLNKNLIILYLNESRAIVNYMIDQGIDAMILSSGIVTNNAFDPKLVFNGSRDSIKMFARQEQKFNEFMIKNYIDKYGIDNNLYLYLTSRISSYNPLNHSDHINVYLMFAEKAYATLISDEETFEYSITEVVYYDHIISNLNYNDILKLKSDLKSADINHPFRKTIIKNISEALDRYDKNN